MIIFYAIALIAHGRETAAAEYVVVKEPLNTQVAETVSPSDIAMRTNTIMTEPSSGDKNQDINIPVDSLNVLKELYDSGILSEEEFTQKKKQLLGLSKS